MAKYNLQGNLEIKDFSDGIVLQRKEWGEDSVIQKSGSTGENLAILAGFTESIEAIMSVKIPNIIWKEIITDKTLSDCFCNLESVILLPFCQI